MINWKESGGTYWGLIWGNIQTLPRGTEKIHEIPNQNNLSAGSDFNRESPEY